MERDTGGESEGEGEDVTWTYVVISFSVCISEMGKSASCVQNCRSWQCDSLCDSVLWVRVKSVQPLMSMHGPSLSSTWLICRVAFSLCFYLFLIFLAHTQNYQGGFDLFMFPSGEGSHVPKRWNAWKHVGRIVPGFVLTSDVPISCSMWWVINAVRMKEGWKERGRVQSTARHNTTLGSVLCHGSALLR